MRIEKLGKTIVEDILALTPMQEGMLIHYLKEPGSDLYFEQLNLRVMGHIDVDYFEQAWGTVTYAGTFSPGHAREGGGECYKYSPWR